jgi:glycosyltransferase involved in cell wall biosynthesis
VVPDSIDDPARPSGGNAYDRRICAELAALGWSVHQHPMAGTWPRPDASARGALASVIAGLPDDAIVLVDGLIASTVPEILAPASRRLRLVVVVHMPLGYPTPGHTAPDYRVSGDDTPGDDVVQAREREVLAAAGAVITTSGWTRRWLLDRYRLRPDQVRIALPGTDTVDLASPTADGGEFLCVAAVTPNKGHDILLAALAMVADRRWQCVCVGSVRRDPGFAERLGRQARHDGIDRRVRFTGPRSGGELAAAYAAADVLLLASHAETYGMVVTEALARGLPVIASAVGGLPEALGTAANGARPGLLVAPGDPAAFASALRRWLDDADLRSSLRHAAEERRMTLPGWPSTANTIARVLAEAGSAATPSEVASSASAHAGQPERE